MRFLRKNTAVRVSVGPFLDVTDGITPEVALTVTNCTCELFVDDDDNSAVNRTAITLSASGGNNDMVHITDDTVGMYDLELTQANTNYNGRVKLCIIDTDVHLPVWEEFTILPGTVYDSLISGTDYLETDVLQIGGGTQSATDLKDLADTGYDPTAHKVQGVVLTDTCTTNSDMRGTNGAALATVCTETRLAELDAANIPTDLSTINGYVDELETRLTALRAGYLDNLSAGAVAQESTLTAIKGAGWTDETLKAIVDLVEALNDISASDVNTQVVDALNVDTYAEPGQGTPSATTTLAAKINYLYKALINQKTQTSTTYSLYNNAATVVDQKATVSDDATTFTKGKLVTGA